MKIKDIKEGIDWFALQYYDEQGRTVLKKVLQFAKYSNLLYYYIIFGDNLYTADISHYCKDYPELDMDSGMIQLKGQDLNNVDLIYTILNQYHACHLYINQEADFMQVNSDITWCDTPFVVGGYRIDMLIDYLNIKKMSDDLPDWELLKKEFELIQQVKLEFPIFVFENDHNACDNLCLCSIILDEKNFKKIKKDLANDDYFTRKIIMDSSGRIYRIAKVHIVGESVMSNLIKIVFHLKNKEYKYVEFEYDEETHTISLEKFKELILSVFNKRTDRNLSNKDNMILLKSLREIPSFKEIAHLFLKKKWCKKNWS